MGGKQNSPRGGKKRGIILDPSKHLPKSEKSMISRKESLVDKKKRMEVCQKEGHERKYQRVVKNNWPGQGISTKKKSSNELA